MSDIPPHRLGGETDPNAWHFSRLKGDRPLPNPVGHTFPFLSHDAEGRWRVIGTGFYVNDSGFFVTAKHVIEDVLQAGRQTSPLVILHLHSSTGLFGPSEVLFRPIGQCWLSDAADVAFGAAATTTNNITGETMKNWTWTLSFSVPTNGSLASTYAFPNHIVTGEGQRIRFSPHAYSGRILSSGDHRDRVMVPFPYLEVNFRIHGAASGGPILVDGRVVGINCTEWSENLDHPAGPGFGAQSHCLSNAFLDNIILPGASSPRRVTFDQLVQCGSVNVEGYIPNNDSSSGTLVDLSLPVAAKRAAIEIEQYF